MVWLVLLYAVFIWCLVPCYVADEIGEGKGHPNGWAWGLLCGWFGVLTMALRPALPRDLWPLHVQEAANLREQKAREAVQRERNRRQQAWDVPPPDPQAD